MVVDHLERQRSRRRIVTNFLLANNVSVEIHQRNTAVLARKRQVVDDCIEQLLHALVLEGRTAQHRHQCACDRTFANAVFQHRRVELAGLDEVHERVVIQGECGFEHFFAQLRQICEPLVIGSGGEFKARGHVRHWHRFPLAVLVVRTPDVADAGNQVDHANELIVAADGNLAQQGIGTEALANALHAMGEVGTHAVHLVDVANARHVVLVREAPVRLGLRLHAGNAVEHHDSAIEHPQAAVHFDGEVHVPGGVDHVDLVTLPLRGYRRALNGDAALAFLLEVVGGSAAFTVFGVMHLDDLVLFPGVVQHPLGRRRFARVDVGDDADVPVELELLLPGHD